MRHGFHRKDHKTHHCGGRSYSMELVFIEVEGRAAENPNV